MATIDWNHTTTNTGFNVPIPSVDLSIQDLRAAGFTVLDGFGGARYTIQISPKSDTAVPVALLDPIASAIVGSVDHTVTLFQIQVVSKTASADG